MPKIHNEGKHFYFLCVSWLFLGLHNFSSWIILWFLPSKRLSSLKLSIVVKKIFHSISSRYELSIENLFLWLRNLVSLLSSRRSSTFIFLLAYLSRFWPLFRISCQQPCRANFRHIFNGLKKVDLTLIDSIYFRPSFQKPFSDFRQKTSDWKFYNLLLRKIFPKKAVPLKLMKHDLYWYKDLTSFYILIPQIC